MNYSNKIKLNIERLELPSWKRNILFVILITAAVLSGFPQIKQVQAHFTEFGFKELNSGIEQPLVFNPDRYQIRTEKRLVTAYSSEVGQCDSTPFETAIGSHVREGIVAANWLPIGTMVRFPDYDPEHWYVVEDRMNTRFNDRTDIWMAETEDARQFGMKRLAMEIATPVK